MTRTVTTTKEYDDNGNLVKETVVEQIVEREVCTRPHADKPLVNPLEPEPYFPKHPGPYWNPGDPMYGTTTRIENTHGPELRAVN